jgi:hypothetical protein
MLDHQLQDIVDDVSRRAAASATLEDRDFHLVAHASQTGGLDRVRQRSILERRSVPEIREWFEQFGIARADRPVRTPADEANGVLSRVCLPARWNGVTYGYLWLLDEDRRLDDALLGDAMHGASRAGALLARQALARERAADRLQSLLSPEPAVAEAAAEEIAELGLIERDRPIVVLVLETLRERDWQAVPLNLWQLPRSVLAAADTDHISLLVPVDRTPEPRIGDGRDGRVGRNGRDGRDGRDGERPNPADRTGTAPPSPAGRPDIRAALDIAQRARDLYADRLDPADRTGVVVGIGAVRDDLAQARASRREARLAVRVARAVPDFRPLARWDELGIFRLLACGPQRELRDAVVDPAIQRLLDDPDGTLLTTARRYLDRAGSAQATAAALNIHRQTLYHRLRRIEQITGLDLADGQDRLRLHLGLSLAPLVAVRTSGG